MSVEEARARITGRLKTRAARFLELVEAQVYAIPRSPYRLLLENAGCQLGDLRTSVQRHGLEPTLRLLAANGVYVSLDEFKGKSEAVRGNRRFRFADGDFDNPRVPPHFVLWTGGTRHPAMAVRTSLAFVEDMAANTAVGLDANGLSGHAHAYWLLSTAVTLGLRMAKLGRPPVAWFYPIDALPRRARLGWQALAFLGGLSRVHLPRPRYVDLKEPERVAAWLATNAGPQRPICVTCYASSAVRVAAVARALGRSLEGVCFVAFGEPFTRAKERIIEESGARVVVHYGFTEGGLLGYRCGNPGGPDDVHLFSDGFALIHEPRPLDSSSATVDGFLLTSLLGTAPKVLLNMELGDHGIVEERECGCGLEALGLAEHISQIRSYEKLTGEGMTFARTDLLRIVEKVLPERFGGTPGDYQLVEEEDEEGILRMLLLASPSLGSLDEGALRAALLGELARDGGPQKLGALAWESVDTVRVRRQDPVVTGAGKILPFHLVRRSLVESEAAQGAEHD
jgi:hypothetical protein